MTAESIFVQTALILAVSAVCGAVALKLRQPLIVAFIAVGVLAGPAGLGLVAADAHLHLLAEIGIAILLFVVGLKLDLHLIRTLGPVALAIGIIQVVLTSLVGFLIARGFDLPVVNALYVAVALSFSSTIIIVKLLSDKKEIDALHGRLAIGLLIVQDIAVVLAMIALTAIGVTGGTDHVWLDGLLMVAKSALFIAGLGLVMRFVLPALLPQLAKSQELLLLTAIAWAVLLATVGDLLGFSKEVGAFLAGVSLASTPYREALASRLVSLRDFLLLFFFINLGVQLDLSALGAQVGAALTLSVFVLVGKPLIVMAIMGYMGYRKRTGSLTGLTVAQISEFSLILASLGVSLGHIDRETLGLITLVGLVTIGLSTYLILYSHPLYARLAPWLGLFERTHPHRELDEEAGAGSGAVDVLLFGLGRYGCNIAHNLLRRGKRVFGVDFDPQVVTTQGCGIPVRYGDAEDPELLDHLPLHQARWVVNTIPGREANLTLLRAIRHKGYPVKVVLTAHNHAEAELYHRAGADKVLWPFVDAAEQAVDYLTAAREEISARAPWSVTPEEVRIRPGTAASGKRLGELALRARTGVAVIAVERTGRSLYDLDSEFLILPGDRLVLLGEVEGLKAARRILEEREAPGEGAESRFRMEEIVLDSGSGWAGCSLAELDLRRRFGLSVIGLWRGEEKILPPSATDRLRAGDRLLLLGPPEAIAAAAAAAAG